MDVQNRDAEAEEQIVRLQDQVNALRKELDAASDADSRQLVRGTRASSTRPVFAPRGFLHVPAYMPTP